MRLQIQFIQVAMAFVMAGCGPEATDNAKIQALHECAPMQPIQRVKVSKPHSGHEVPKVVIQSYNTLLYSSCDPFVLIPSFSETYIQSESRLVVSFEIDSRTFGRTPARLPIEVLFTEDCKKFEKYVLQDSPLEWELLPSSYKCESERWESTISI